MRFYLGGTQWFRNNVGLTSNALAEYRKEGLKRLLALSEENKIDWRYAPGCQDNDMLYWGDVARTQYRRAFSEKPMRRFTRLTNAFSKKVDSHAHAVALHFMYYNFVRIHNTLRVIPAMAAGVSDPRSLPRAC